MNIFFKQNIFNRNQKIVIFVVYYIYGRMVGDWMGGVVDIVEKILIYNTNVIGHLKNIIYEK